MKNAHRTKAVGGALLALSLFGAACSSAPGNDTPSKAALPTAKIPAQSKIDAVAKLVPPVVAITGKITYAMDASYLPDEWIAPGSSTIVGMDADLGKAVAETMGLSSVQSNVPFTSIIPGLLTNTYDAGISSLVITAARSQIVDFVEYFKAGQAFYVKAGSSTAYRNQTSLCGHSVAVKVGTIEAIEVKDTSKACVTDGKDRVKVLTFTNQNGMNVAVTSGRADVGFADSQVAGYVVARSRGELELSGKPFAVTPFGIATPKGNGMAPAISAAVNALIANGTYGKILAKWGLEAGAVTAAPINPPAA
jgi:polar amino acid transport system substrate-binding protein